jgi:hypothetical protein
VGAETGFSFTVTTQGVGALVGWGSEKDFSGMFGDSQKLVLHPMSKSAGDLSADFCFWKAYPLLGSIVKSGENPQTAAITFRVFPDPDRTPRLFVLGDHR